MQVASGWALSHLPDIWAAGRDSRHQGGSCVGLQNGGGLRALSPALAQFREQAGGQVMSGTVARSQESILWKKGAQGWGRGSSGKALALCCRQLLCGEVEAG